MSFRNLDCKLFRFAVFTLVILLADSSCGQTLQPDEEIQSIVQTFVESNALPGAVMAIAEAKRPLRIAAAGVRKLGGNSPLSIHDKMHLGSCTKAMTATLLGRLVDQNKLRFASTIGEILPELEAHIHPNYHDVTLEQLLTHQSGMPANAANWWIESDQPVSQTRLAIAKLNLAAAPSFPPGTKTQYSNLGYMVAGLMAEKSGDKSWEELIQQEVFGPLQLRSAGFGPPSVAGNLDQPWGHVVEFSGQMKSSQHDNAPALGPAGRVHMTFAGWSTFALAHATNGATLSDQKFLRQVTWNKLHTAQNGENAMGWFVSNRSWADGTTFMHSGSNTMWFCTVWIAPHQKRAYLIGVNAAGANTETVVDSAFGKLIELANPN